MIIEFIGEAGCGKSTLVNALTESLLASGVTVSDRKDNLQTMPEKIAALSRFLYCFLTVKDYRRIFWALLWLTMNKMKDCNRRTCIFYIILLLNLYYGKSSGVVLIDQGIVQYLHSVYFRVAPQDKKYQDILGRLSKLAAVHYVYCACSPDINLQRVMQRGSSQGRKKSRIDRYTEPDLLRLFTFHDGIFQLLLACLPKERMLQVDTSDAMARNVRAVHSLVVRAGITVKEDIAQ